MKHVCVQVYFLTTGKGKRTPIHKKESRQLKKTTDRYHYYLSVVKFLRKLFLTPCIRHFTDNQLLTPNQSGFRPGDSTINQLLYITQKISTAFEDFPSRQTRAVFLDISKAFVKVWHEGLVFK